MTAACSTPPYDPTTETMKDEEIVVACRWELLRRHPGFRAVAKKWVASTSFRKAHALTREYLDFVRLAPRCALDWMLTPTERVKLAQFQIAKRTWQLGKGRNFGPVVWRFRNRMASMSRKTAYDSIEVKP